jgi:hypothetical protein
MGRGHEESLIERLFIKKRETTFLFGALESDFSRVSGEFWEEKRLKTTGLF